MVRGRITSSPQSNYVPIEYSYSCLKARVLWVRTYRVDNESTQNMLRWSDFTRYASRARITNRIAEWANYELMNEEPDLWWMMNCGESMFAVRSLRSLEFWVLGSASRRTACNSSGVAQSCTLRRTGTSPCSASVRFSLWRRRSLTRNGDVPISSRLQDSCDSWKIHMQSCGVAAHSLRRGERICKISVFPAPLARAHWLALNHMQCIRVIRGL